MGRTSLPASRASSSAGALGTLLRQILRCSFTVFHIRLSSLLAFSLNRTRAHAPRYFFRIELDDDTRGFIRQLFDQRISWMPSSEPFFRLLTYVYCLLLVFINKNQLAG